MASTDWLYRRNRAIHITIRDVDCRDFDVPRFIADMRALHVTFFSFFAGGYVTTYPTDLRYQRMSPELDGRDLTGEIVAEAHRHGIQVFPMIDLGMVPEAAARDHPDWISVNAEGQPYRMQFEGPYRACILSGYVREYSRAFVQEVIDRYPVDGIKFGGASYGFNREICYCDTCRQRYREERGHQIPTARDWDDPVWHDFIDWRMAKVVETVDHLNRMVKSIDPEMPITGNSVCYGDPGWTMRASFDIERMAAIQDAAQVEVQTRLHVDDATDEVDWQYMRWPAETASFMDATSDRPFWTVASYFIAWPWRRNAAPYHEQTAYLALGAAHGASLMVNLSGGPPAVHEDKRGFQAVEEIYGFMARNDDYLQGDHSPANVAVVYSLDTLAHWGGKDKTRYVDELRGVEHALFEAHIPFDIISQRTVADKQLGQYDLLILPNMACISDEAVEGLGQFLAEGGNLIASHETGCYKPLGARRDPWALAPWLGADYAETLPVLDPGYSEPQQAYWRAQPGHPLTAWLESELLPAQGHTARIIPRAEDLDVAFSLTAPFRVFPEGLSYPERPDPGYPMLVTRETPAGGRIAYYAGHVGLTYFCCRFPDYGELLARTVRWALGEPLPMRVDGPPTLHAAWRAKGDREMIHLVNLTGGTRFFRAVVPVQKVRLGIRATDENPPAAKLLSSGEALTVSRDDGYWWVTVPEVTDYEIVAFEP